MVRALQYPVLVRIEPLQRLQLPLVHAVGVGVRALVPPAPEARHVGEVEAGRHQEVVAEEVVALLRIVDLDGMDLVELGADEVQQRQPVLGLAVAAVLAALVIADFARVGRVAFPERQIAGAAMQRQQTLQQRRAGAGETEYEQRTADLLVREFPGGAQ